MKLISFERNNTSSWGIWRDDGIVDLGKEIGAKYPTLKSALADLEFVSNHASAPTSFGHDDVTLLPPVPDPGRIICVGLNYKSHIAETGRDTPAYPMIFPRYPESLVGTGQPLIRPRASHMFDFEGELAFIVGKRGRHITAANALDHIAGFACFNDGSLRDWQRHTSQFMAGKTFWRSGAFGPWLVTTDEVGAVGSLKLVTRLNGVIMQQANLDDLLFGAPELVEYLSTILPLEAGDVVATGTTGGVGLFRDPQVWMKPGDTVEVEIERLGTLRNTIQDEPQD